jgi:hypothetical protein
MLRRSHRLAATLLPVLLLASCVGRDDRQEAEQVLAHHFDTLAHHGYDAALLDYDDLFFEDVTRTEWRNALSNVADKLGNVQGYDISVHGLESKTIAAPGTYLKYKCKVTYSKNTSEETFYLFRRAGAQRFKILGHQIDSSGLVSR